MEHHRFSAFCAYNYALVIRRRPVSPFDEIKDAQLFRVLSVSAIYWVENVDFSLNLRFPPFESTMF